MSAFSDNVSGVLLATPASARGLDAIELHLLRPAVADLQEAYEKAHDAIEGGAR